MKKTYFKSLLIIVFTTLFCHSNAISQSINEPNYRSWIRTKKPNSNKKIALVIGNSEYEGGGRLSYPAENARRIASALEAQGFDVQIGYNLGLETFYQVIDDFSEKFKDYQSALIFYAGHGMEIEGKNYLVPIDAAPETQNEARRQCYNLEELFLGINEPAKPKFIILDACRNNPFKSFKRGEAELARVEAMKNSMIVFSTSKNTRVRDDNPFTNILSKYIEQGGCMDDILKNVNKEIANQFVDQSIWQVASLYDDLCFGDAIIDIKDTDKDGVTDNVDKCPYKQGSPMAMGCPDDDEDGVPNSDDDCPNQKGSSLYRGCPPVVNVVIDNDQDGIPNEEDECPNEKGVIDNNGCPDGKEYAPAGPINGNFSDNRDQVEYEWIRLKDGKKWLAENISFEDKNSWCYQNKKKNCTQYGRLYTWEAAQKACPEGWKLPSRRDWEKLISIYEKGDTSYDALIQDGKSGFNANLLGMRDLDTGFHSKDIYGNFWTSSEEDGNGIYYSFDSYDKTLYELDENKETAFACRCIEE